MLLLGLMLTVVLVVSGCGSSSASTTEQTPVTTGIPSGDSTPNASVVPTSPTGVTTPTIPPTSSTPIKTGSLQPGIAGKVWTLSKFIQAGQNYTLVPNAPITLRLETQGTTASGVVTCNHYSGVYSATATSMRMTISNITQVKCSDAAEAFQKAYLDAMPHVQVYTLSSGKLVLASSDNQYQMTFSAS
jgi:heat shock protein HslJ